MDPKSCQKKILKKLEPLFIVNIPKNVADKQIFGDVDFYVSPKEEMKDEHIDIIR